MSLPPDVAGGQPIMRQSRVWDLKLSIDNVNILRSRTLACP